MILGTGIDLIETDRVEQRLNNNSGFREYVFHETEIEYCESKANKAEHYSARFAAKEALLKALGTGLTGGIPLNEIAVLNNAQGKPSFMFFKTAEQIIKSKGNLTLHLSLSHLKTIACAMVVIEQRHE